MSKTDMTDATDATDATDEKHIDSGEIELTVRLRESPVESTYPWNRPQVVIDADTHDECVVVLGEDGTPRSDTAIHIASTSLAPEPQPQCHQPLTTGDAPDGEPIACRVSQFESESVTDRLCGGCVGAVLRDLRSYFGCSHDEECTITPYVVAERRIVFFHSLSESQGGRT